LPEILVVIPYFQRRPGILRRALASIAAQRLEPDVRLEVTVVDDGSPAPAAPEIDGLDLPGCVTLRLLEQPNAGVSAARNAALTAGGGRHDFVAFLDSDDIWHEDHVATALRALGAGQDFYFCDNLNHRPGEGQSHFLASGFLKVLESPVAPGEFGVLPPATAIRQIIERFPAQISTVMLRQRAVGSRLFPRDLRLAGEDMLFLCLCASEARGVTFSPAAHVTCADGENIYYGAQGWDDPAHPILVLDRIISYRILRDQAALERETASWIQTYVRKLEVYLTYLLARQLLRRRWGVSKPIGQVWARHPSFWRRLPQNLFRACLARMRGELMAG
jgi:succinoglycan biosynthesis protein ExoW